MRLQSIKMALAKRNVLSVFQLGCLVADQIFYIHAHSTISSFRIVSLCVSVNDINDALYAMLRRISVVLIHLHTVAFTMKSLTREVIRLIVLALGVVLVLQFDLLMDDDPDQSPDPRQV